LSAITEEVVDSASIAAASTGRKSLWALAIRNPAVIFGGAILMVMLAIAILAPLLGTVDPTRIDPAARNKKPGAEITFRLDDGTTAKRTAIMGTDSLGRDVYSRVIYGTRVSLVIGVAVAIIAVLFFNFLQVKVGNHDTLLRAGLGRVLESAQIGGVHGAH
jgi:peptide/nickel transport system permease protein